MRPAVCASALRNSTALQVSTISERADAKVVGSGSLTILANDLALRPVDCVWMRGRRELPA